MSKARSAGLRVAGEFLLVVVGVLMALQLQAMRDARETRQREETELLALLDDMRENQQRLATLLRNQEQVVASARRVIRISNGDEPAPAPDSVVQAISWSLQFFRLEPVTGAYDALVASGDLRLIRNAALRSALASFVADAKSGSEDEGISDLLRIETVSAIAESTPLLSVLRPGLRSFADLPVSSRPPDLDGLLSNQKYLSYLALLGPVESGIRGYFSGLHDRAGEIVSILEEELGVEPEAL